MSNMTVIGYCRVSTDKQENSLEVQEKVIRGQVAAKGWELSEMIVDPAEWSGDLQRPGAKRLLEMVNAKKIGAVIITKLDRLTRSTRDAIELMTLMNRKKVTLISISEGFDMTSTVGKAMMKIISVFAEMERELIGDRTRAALQHLKSQGFSTGNAPYGWQSAGKRKTLLRSDAEQSVRDRIVNLFGQGFSLRAISDTLNVLGFKTRRGTPWRHQYVANILKSEAAAQ